MPTLATAPVARMHPSAAPPFAHTRSAVLPAVEQEACWKSHAEERASPLLSWVEEELRARLRSIEAKLERVLALQQLAAPAPPPGPPPGGAGAAAEPVAAPAAAALPSGGAGGSQPTTPSARSTSVWSAQESCEEATAASESEGERLRLPPRPRGPRAVTSEKKLPPHPGDHSSEEEEKTWEDPNDGYVMHEAMTAGDTWPRNSEKESTRHLEEEDAESMRSISTYEGHMLRHAGPDIARRRRVSMVEAAIWHHEKTSQRCRIFEHIWGFLEDPESSWGAMMYQRITPVLFLMTLVVTLSELSDSPPLGNVTYCILEVTIEVLFTIEVTIRFVVSPSLAVYFENPYNILDMMSLCPLPVRLSTGPILDVQRKDRSSISLAILLGFVPVIRLLKVLRQFHKFHLLLRAFRLAWEAMPVIVFIYGSIFLVFSTLVYLVEPHENIRTIPGAMWLTIVTMMTVGYGDVTPQSTAGRFVCSVLTFTTSLYMAIPLGIIGNAFSEVWADRDRILLSKHARQRLVQCGYKSTDLPRLFQLFDKDRNGKLDLEEFAAMITDMDLGLSAERVEQLFNLADRDGSNAVNPMEFIKLLYPNEFLEIYGPQPPRLQGSNSRQDGLEDIDVSTQATRGASSAGIASAVAGTDIHPIVFARPIRRSHRGSQRSPRPTHLSSRHSERTSYGIYGVRRPSRPSMAPSHFAAPPPVIALPPPRNSVSSSDATAQPTVSFAFEPGVSWTPSPKPSGSRASSSYALGSSYVLGKHSSLYRHEEGAGSAGASASGSTTLEL